ncbi:MAG TPA: hypothetical protein VHW95_01315 [Steroidobacteraceae bacterium]|jgi:PBP1b-binding outer membrane lipoprotein LpoB|nr:hypothetical protein [Steroidobacteraceae bacterium]
MRALMLMTAMLICGCAGQPATPISSPAAAVPTAGIEAQRLAQARNLNLRVVNKDGHRLFCRSNYMTASRIRQDTTCYSADQLDEMEARQQRELDQLNSRPAPAGKNPFQ